MNRIKTTTLALLLCASPLIIVLPTGCALFSKTATTQQKLSEVRNLSYAASSIGTGVALKQNPGWRPQFEAAYHDLDQLVTQKTVSGDFLRNTIASLPVKELRSDTARIAIEGVTLLYDETVGSQVNIEDQPYVLAAATGIRDGMQIALGLGPLK